MHVAMEPLSEEDLIVMSPQEEVETLDGATMQPSLSGPTEVRLGNETEIMQLMDSNITSCAPNSTIHEINGLLVDEDFILPDSAAPRGVDLDGDDAEGPSGDEVSLRGGDFSEQGDDDSVGDGDDDSVWLGMNTGTIAGVFAAAAVGLLLMGLACCFFVFGGKRRKAKEDAGAGAAAGAAVGAGAAAGGGAAGGGTSSIGASPAGGGASTVSGSTVSGAAAGAGAGTAVGERSHHTPAGGSALRSIGVWEDDEEEVVYSAPLPASLQSDPFSPRVEQPWLTPSNDSPPAAQAPASQQSWMQALFTRNAGVPAGPAGTAPTPQAERKERQLESQLPLQSDQGPVSAKHPEVQHTMPPSPTQSGSTQVCSAASSPTSSVLGGAAPVSAKHPEVQHTMSASPTWSGSVGGVESYPVRVSPVASSPSSPVLGVLSESTQIREERMRSANPGSGSPGAGSAQGMLSHSTKHQGMWSA